MVSGFSLSGVVTRNEPFDLENAVCGMTGGSSVITLVQQLEYDGSVKGTLSKMDIMCAVKGGLYA